MLPEMTLLRLFLHCAPSVLLSIGLMSIAHRPVLAWITLAGGIGAYAIIRLFDRSALRLENVALFKLSNFRPFEIGPPLWVYPLPWYWTSRPGTIGAWVVAVGGASVAANTLEGAHGRALVTLAIAAKVALVALLVPLWSPGLPVQLFPQLRVSLNERGFAVWSRFAGVTVEGAAFRRRSIDEWRTIYDALIKVGADQAPDARSWPPWDHELQLEATEASKSLIHNPPPSGWLEVVALPVTQEALPMGYLLTVCLLFFALGPWFDRLGAVSLLLGFSVIAVGVVRYLVRVRDHVYVPYPLSIGPRWTAFRVSEIQSVSYVAAGFGRADIAVDLADGRREVIVVRASGTVLTHLLRCLGYVHDRSSDDSAA